jgi:hypothetical protein
MELISGGAAVDPGGRGWGRGRLPLLPGRTGVIDLTFAATTAAIVRSNNADRYHYETTTVAAIM